MTFDNEGIRVEEVRTCPLCGQPGRSLYELLRDRLLRAPGTWSLLKCGGCGLVWLNPQPAPEDIGKLYVHYYTNGKEGSSVSPGPVKVSWHLKVRLSVLAAHYGYRGDLPGPWWERIGKMGRLLPLLRDAAGAFVMFLPAAAGGRLLDIGCGNGAFLASMRERGWQVQGVEPDPEAARLARERYGLEVITGPLEGAALPAASVDAITMHHVIEHVPDPVALLGECCRVLRPGGKLVAVTPNAEGLGHRLFGIWWFGLDPPRHLHLFSLRTLQACAGKAGLRIESLRSISRQCRNYYLSSRAICHGELREQNAYRLTRRVAMQAWAFLALEEALHLLNGKLGEESVLIATRPG